jgi:ankyrin repeat protein
MGISASSSASKALLKACETQNHAEMLEALDNGAKLETLSKEGKTPLWLAVEKCYKNEELALELIRRGANCRPKPPRAASAGGTTTLLSFTMSANQARIAAALIEAGAGRDQEGWGTAAKERRTGRGQGPGPVGRWQGPVFTTPVLNEMIASGFPDRAWALIEAGGVGVNAQNLSNGKTPLMLAIEGGHRDLAIKLCRLEDLDTSAENNAGSTALQMARGEGFDDVAAAIVRAKQWKSMRQAEQQQQP